MINDRGKIKWTAMMLPEHKELIQKMQDKIFHEVEKPLLSEDKLEQFDKIIQEAYITKKKLKFSVYQNKKITEISGQILRVNSSKRTLTIANKEKRLEINVDSLIEITELITEL